MKTMERYCLVCGEPVQVVLSKGPDVEWVYCDKHRKESS